jgi:glycosyltransferase involved in cell wall biosynthesis
MARVSVIIPNYNHATFLEKRIDSILDQTYSDFEVIILDDHSSDNSREVIEKYRNHPKVSHVIFNEVNSGSTFKQWKKGFQLTKGDWIWIAESDDWCEPGLLTELISPVEANKDITVSFCQSVVINPENKILYTTNWEELAGIMDGHRFVREFMLVTNRIQNASMAIFRKDCIANVPDDYTNMRFCGDWFFWVNLSIQGNVHISGKYLNYYLRHDNNVATRAIKEGVDFLEGNKIFEFIVSNLRLSSKEREVALGMLVDKYLAAERYFLNTGIRNTVLHSMIALDPSVQSLFNKKNREKRSKEVHSAIKRFLLSPLFN